MPWPRTRRKASRRFWGSARRVGAGSERIKAADEPSWAAGTRPTRGDENVTSEVAENRASANCFQNNTDKRRLSKGWVLICVTRRSGVYPLRAARLTSSRLPEAFWPLLLVVLRRKPGHYRQILQRRHIARH